MASIGSVFKKTPSVGWMQVFAIKSITLWYCLISGWNQPWLWTWYPLDNTGILHCWATVICVYAPRTFSYQTFVRALTVHWYLWSDASWSIWPCVTPQEIGWRSNFKFRFQVQLKIPKFPYWCIHGTWKFVISGPRVCSTCALAILVSLWKLFQSECLHCCQFERFHWGRVIYWGFRDELLW